MNMYVKKPIPVQAIKWTGENIDEIVSFCPVCYKKGSDDDTLLVSTLEGVMTANLGDYIIKGIKGEFYPCKQDIFEESYVNAEDSAEFHEFAHKQMPKSLHNTTSNGARQNVKDIVFWGDGDTFKLISKASSEAEGWMKSTKAMEIYDVGCVVQTTTQQRNLDGSYSLTDAVTFVPSTIIEEIKDSEGGVIARKLIRQFKA